MKTNLLRRMMAVMAAFLVTMFTLPMMAGNKVEINGVSKQVYGHDVNEVSEYDNAFSIVIYLSQDRKERLLVMGDNDRHATGKFVSIKSHQPVVEGQCPWVVRYVRDDRFAVQTVGYASYETALFESGAFCVTGNPRGGRFGLTLYGKITDNVKGDGNAYTFDVDLRTEWTAPIPGTFSIGQITDSSIALTWTPATDNDTPQEDLSYSVEYQKEGDDGWEMTPLTKNLTSYVIEGLDPASNYRVDVRVEDMSGNYKRYGEVSVTTKKEDFGLMIAGTEVTRGNCGDLSSINGVEGKASFDPETYTLYLDGATINGGTTNAIFMSGDKELTINVSNDVTLSSDESSVLRLMGNVTINGEGTLNVTAVDSRCGIYMFKDLVIDRCTVIASGDWGIAGENGSAERLIVRAATVKATGGDYAPIADLKSLSLLGCRIVTPEGGEYNTTNHYVMLDGAPWLGTVVISPVVQQSDLVLLKQSNDGNNKAPIVKIIRELTGLGLLECSQLYDNAPSVIAENLTLLVADEAAEKLRALGAEVEVRPHANPDGIEGVLAAPGQKLKGIYTFTGNRLDTPFEKLPSGIYIVNGKKVTKK
ncbi:MAG: ribosomal protein L7/L12 [Bacteroidaceae bacterium]|nr:ribosomal protein L7/L12 [Bacteroidaceae bacterium]